MSVHEKSTAQCVFMGICAGVAGGGFLLARVFQMKSGFGPLPDMGVILTYPIAAAIGAGVSRDRVVGVLAGLCFAGLFDVATTAWGYYLTRSAMQLIREMHR